MFISRVVSAFIAIAVLSVFTSVGQAAAPTPAERGSIVFQDNDCEMCHQVAPGKGGDQGPILQGVVGRKIASVPGFAYSNALKAKGQTWTKENLDKFLNDPAAFAPGTLMSANITDAADRAALIAFLETIK